MERRQCVVWPSLGGLAACSADVNRPPLLHSTYAATYDVNAGVKTVIRADTWKHSQCAVYLCTIV